VAEEQKKEIPLPMKNGETLISSLMNLPFSAQIAKIKNIKCLESINYSTFNPVLPFRKMEGDIFYLNVQTLDCGEHGITCSISGFFKNDSIEKVSFSPEPSKKHNPCFSYSLFGTII